MNDAKDNYATSNHAVSDSESYASDVTRKAEASWERRKGEAIGRWGSLDRLASKCSAETSAKFAKAKGRLADARTSLDEFELARRLGVMERGVDAMEREALEAGYSPVDMQWFDLKIRVGDRRAVAVLNPQDADYVAATLSREFDDGVIVYTVADIVLMAHENPSALTHLKQIAGAYTTQVTVGDQTEAPW
jgi:hypothetical protein